MKEKERIGIGFTGESARALSVQELVPHVVRAEKLGFESIWMAEDYYYRNAIVALTKFASSTKKIKLATGIINPITRDPALIAMSFAGLDEISKNRSIIGLGSSLRLKIYEPHLNKVNYLAAMKECVEIIRKLLTGEKITYEGSVFKVRNVKLGVKPSRSNIPIYIGAMGPKMLQLAGEIADGVLLTAGAAPEYIKLAVKNIEIGAHRAGRKLDEIDVASFVILSISKKDCGVVKRITRRELAFLITLPAFDYVLKACGLLEAKNVQVIREYGRKGEMGKAAEHVSEELINALAIYGKPKDCLEKFEEYRTSGLDLPVIVPIGEYKHIKIILNMFAKR
jgi:5,10-methylenetetrahydromethanopterin reductase